jgi:hypothetical protein
MNLPDSPPSDGKPRHLFEDIFILVCILVLWPVILGWNHLIYEILLYAALAGLVWIFYRRIKRFHQARDEMNKN